MVELYHKIFSAPILYFANNVCYKILDRGFFELIGPTGFWMVIQKLSTFFKLLHNGSLFHYLRVNFKFIILTVLFFLFLFSSNKGLLVLLIGFIIYFFSSNFVREKKIFFPFLLIPQESFFVNHILILILILFIICAKSFIRWQELKRLFYAPELAKLGYLQRIKTILIVMSIEFRNQEQEIEFRNQEIEYEYMKKKTMDIEVRRNQEIEINKITISSFTLDISIIFCLQVLGQFVQPYLFVFYCLDF
jgi:hypothetical protein